MATPLKKKKYYDFETKLKVVFARKQGMSHIQIQQKFKIVNIRQIQYWIKYFKNGDLHRLQQKSGHLYKDKTSINLNPDITEIKKIKQKFKANLKINKQTLKDACLTIINQYCINRMEVQPHLSNLSNIFCLLKFRNTNS